MIGVIQLVDGVTGLVAGGMAGPSCAEWYKLSRVVPTRVHKQYRVNTSCPKLCQVSVPT